MAHVLQYKMELYNIMALYQGEDRISCQSFVASHVLGREFPMTQDEFTQLVSGVLEKHDYHMRPVIDDLVQNHGFTQPECKTISVKLGNISIREAQKKAGW